MKSQKILFDYFFSCTSFSNHDKNNTNGHKTISYTNTDGFLTTEIFLPPTIREDLASIRAYTFFLDEQSATYVASNMGVADIPRLREAFQIPPSVRIHIPEENKRASFYRPSEACFYDIAFERGLRFPIDDTVKDLLVSLDLAPCQLHPNSWACLIAPILMSRAMSNGKYEITLQEWLHLFQPKEVGHKSASFYVFLVRVRSDKVVQGLLNGLRD